MQSDGIPLITVNHLTVQLNWNISVKYLQMTTCELVLYNWTELKKNNLFSRWKFVGSGDKAMYPTCRQTYSSTKFMIKEHPFLPVGCPALFFNSTFLFSMYTFFKITIHYRFDFRICWFVFFAWRMVSSINKYYWS